MATLPPEQCTLPPQLAPLLSTTGRQEPQRREQQQEEQQEEEQQQLGGPAAAGPICCDFGSMAAVGLIPDPGRLLRVLHGAAAALQRPFILLAGAPVPWTASRCMPALSMRAQFAPWRRGRRGLGDLH